jgi:hypothetical protein
MSLFSKDFTRIFEDYADGVIDAQQVVQKVAPAAEESFRRMKGIIEWTPHTEDALKELWSVIVRQARTTSWDTSADEQEALVHLLAVLKNRRDPEDIQKYFDRRAGGFGEELDAVLAEDVHDGAMAELGMGMERSLWNHLHGFESVLTLEAKHFEPGQTPEGRPCPRKKAANFHAFLARLTAGGVGNFAKHIFWTIKYTLEPKLFNAPHAGDQLGDYLPMTYVWVDIAAQQLWDGVGAVKGMSNSTVIDYNRWKNRVSWQRWTRWIAELENIGQKDGETDAVKDMAKRTAQKMKDVQVPVECRLAAVSIQE